MSSSTTNHRNSSQQHSRPSRSASSTGKIGKVSISFGNPALGTYHGNVYTINDDERDEASASSSGPQSATDRPIVEGAESVQRIVAMVDVPPEQVPEGILNLARSHRPFIDHVRIVIEEDMARVERQQQEQCQDELSTSFSGLGFNSVTLDGDDSNFPRSPSASASAIESAASILAADEALEAQKRLERGQQKQQQQGQQQKQAVPTQQLMWPMEDDSSQVGPSRTYLVLVELCTDEDAANFVRDLHGKPFTILDPSVTCSVHHVVALQGDDGVSLMNPFFAPSTKSSATGGLEILPSTTLSSHESSNSNTNINSTEDASSVPSSPHLPEDQNCAVCLEHMVLDRTRFGDERTSILTTVCNHTFHLDCLLKWQDSPCPVCRYDHSGLNEALSQCHLCGTTEHNYVCLICGVVSCVGTSVAAARTALSAASGGDASCGSTTHSSSVGHTTDANQQTRFVSSHARQHYDETLHAYALDTETQHVWDFAGQGYVHRLLQNKEDGKLVEVHDPNNTTSQERSTNPGLSDAQEGEVVHRKLEGFASQYYTLLKSQLEQQRIFYEGRLGELRNEFSSAGKAKPSKTTDFLAALRQERRQLNQRLMTLQRRHQKVTDDVAFLKSMNESLESNKAPLKRKISEVQRQRIDARNTIQMYLPALEEKVRTLMLELEGSEPEPRECAPSTPNDDRKPASHRK
jgi:BRCA1-associated protein